MDDDHRISDLQDQVDCLSEQLRITREALLGLDDDRWDGFHGRFTRTQELILRTLYVRQQIVSRQAMYTSLYSDRLDADWPEPRVLDVMISNLRRKLPKGSIETSWGRGWGLTQIGINWVDGLLKKDSSNGQG